MAVPSGFICLRLVVSSSQNPSCHAPVWRDDDTFSFHFIEVLSIPYVWPWVIDSAAASFEPGMDALGIYYVSAGDMDYVDYAGYSDCWAIHT
jgi:hypothetical protein